MLVTSSFMIMEQLRLDNNVQVLQLGNEEKMVDPEMRRARTNAACGRRRRRRCCCRCMEPAALLLINQKRSLNAPVTSWPLIKLPWLALRQRRRRRCYVAAVCEQGRALNVMTIKN